jgi:hypothetical protein
MILVSHFVTIDCVSNSADVPSARREGAQDD